MPTFDFRCASGHETEERVSRETRSVRCACGLRAQRKLSAPHLVGLGGRAPTPRDQKVLHVGEYQEAAQEIDHQWSRIEQASEGVISRPDYFGIANRRAQDVLAQKAR